MEDAKLPPPTVNDLANLHGHAMLRPLSGGDRQRAGIVHLRDRPQWQELLPRLQQLDIEVVLADDLPWFDGAVVDWMQQTKKGLPPIADIKTSLRKPFPERKRTSFTDAVDLMEWTDFMWKGAYPSRKVAVPLYDPTMVVPIQLTTEELEVILTQTEISKTKKLRPKLETTVLEGRGVELDIHEWSRVLLALCAARTKDMTDRRDLLGMAESIANNQAEALRIDPPVFPME
jgi:hypothetical protein